MATKESYEAGRAARKADRDALIEKAQKDEKSVTDLMKSAFDLADRLVTALERIADNGSSLSLVLDPSHSVKHESVGSVSTTEVTPKK